MNLMNLNQIERFARISLHKFGLDTKFPIVFESVDGRGGAVEFVRGEHEGILHLSTDLQFAPVDKVADVVLHETAHCIDVANRGFSCHDDEWKRIARLIGAPTDEVIDLYGVFA